MAESRPTPDPSHVPQPRVARMAPSGEWALEWPSGAASWMPDEKTARTLAFAPELKDELRKAADMLADVIGDLDDGFDLGALRGKYAHALLERRDDARSLLARAQREEPE